MLHHCIVNGVRQPRLGIEKEVFNSLNKQNLPIVSKTSLFVSKTS